MFDYDMSNRLSDAVVASIFASGLVAICVSAALFFGTGRARPLALAIYLLGFAVVWSAAFLAVEQIVRHTTPSGIEGFPPGYWEEPRHDLNAIYLLYVSLIFLPFVAVRGIMYARSLDRERLKKTFLVHLKNGLELSRHRDFDAAIAEFDQAIQLEPGHAESFFRRGHAHMNKGDLASALSDFNQALTLDPGLSDAYLNRAEVHVLRGFDDLALVDFDTSLDLQPNLPEGYLHRGLCRVKRGNVQGAAADFRKVVHLTNNADLTAPALRYLQQLGLPV